MLAADRDGYLHLSGNMHARPLVYFRSARPWDVDSFEAVDRMTGREEQRVTYPKFFAGAKGELIFTYRDGGSGNGNQIFDIYDAGARSWRRMLDTPLLDGEGEMNAYPLGPVQGPDGWFHLLWVWRDTPDASTNHDLSYARSRDLVKWKTAAGAALALPVRIGRRDAVIDPVPAQGGLLNGGEHLGFDGKGRPVVAYHKHDAEGFTQCYVTRFESGKWKARQVSDWRYRWEFGGGGSIGREIVLQAPRVEHGGGLRVQFEHSRYGRGAWLIDEGTLVRKANAEYMRAWPESLEMAESEFPGMEVRMADKGGYLLRWETLGPNRDRPREGALPAPSMLRLYELHSR